MQNIYRWRSCKVTGEIVFSRLSRVAAIRIINERMCSRLVNQACVYGCEQQQVRLPGCYRCAAHMFFHRVKLSYDNILRKPSNAGVLILVFDSPRAVRSCEIVFGAIVYPACGHACEKPQRMLPDRCGGAGHVSLHSVVNSLRRPGKIHGEKTFPPFFRHPLSPYHKWGVCLVILSAQYVCMDA